MVSTLTINLQIDSFTLGACLVGGHAQIAACVSYLCRKDMERTILSEPIPVHVEEPGISLVEVNRINERVLIYTVIQTWDCFQPEWLLVFSR